MIINKDTLDISLNLPSYAVYGLINDLDRRVYISYSTDLIMSVKRKLDELSEVGYDYRNNRVYIKVFDEVRNRSIQKQFVSQIQEYYKSLGYSFYKLTRTPIYRVQLIVEKDMLVYVYLIARNYSKQIVGLFSKMSEAEEFGKLLQNNRPIIPVFALNGYTRSHCKDELIDRNDFRKRLKVKSKYNQELEIELERS